jgi:DNA polymerase III alpha subunit
MAFLMVEDQQGMVEVLCFSDSWLEAETVIKSDEPVLLYGEVKAEGEPGNRSFKLRLARAVLIGADLSYSDATHIEVGSHYWWVAAINGSAVEGTRTAAGTLTFADPPIEGP